MCHKKLRVAVNEIPVKNINLPNIPYLGCAVLTTSVHPLAIFLKTISTKPALSALSHSYITYLKDVELLNPSHASITIVKYISQALQFETICVTFQSFHYIFFCISWLSDEKKLCALLDAKNFL